VVVEVLITQSDPEYPLADQRPDLVLDQVLTADIAEALRKTPDNTKRPVGCLKKQRSRIRRDRTPVKFGHNFAPPNGCKSKQLCVTLCRHRDSPRNTRKALSQNDFR
jgi:hypothetical protein